MDKAGYKQELIATRKKLAECRRRNRELEAKLGEQNNSRVRELERHSAELAGNLAEAIARQVKLERILEAMKEERRTVMTKLVDGFAAPPSHSVLDEVAGFAVDAFNEQTQKVWELQDRLDKALDELTTLSRVQGWGSA